MEATATTERLQRDYQLVCDARDHGNSRAYASLMHLYREPLRLLLLRMTRNADAADDLTMETFGKAFHQLHRYAPSSSFSSWLYTIGVHTFIDHLRRQKLQTTPLSSLETTGDGDYVEYPIASTQLDPEEALIRRQRDERLKTIVDQLNEPYRHTVRLRYYEDMSYEQIAAATHVPVGTVKARLSRAKSLLQAALQEKGGEL